MIKCPRCGAETPEDEWNCVSCRINVYWASQHYEEMARIREEHGLRPVSTTPAFLISTHRSAMDERGDYGGHAADSKVREIARAAMREKSGS
jgi:hypothetical protein